VRKMPGKTMLILKINPADMEKVGETAEAVKGIKTGEVKDVQKVSIGFGAEIVKAGILINEKEEGASDRVLEEINALPEVEDAEVEGMTLL